MGVTGDSDKKLTLSIPEVAKLLSIGRNSAYEAARRGELPIVIIGRRILVPIAALERMLLEAGKAPPGGQE